MNIEIAKNAGFCFGVKRATDRLEEAIARMGCNPPVPAVFIGGKLVGSMDRVMASHISGSLVPLLKEAGALWL